VLRLAFRVHFLRARRRAEPQRNAPVAVMVDAIGREGSVGRGRGTQRQHEEHRG